MTDDETPDKVGVAEKWRQRGFCHMPGTLEFEHCPSCQWLRQEDELEATRAGEPDDDDEPAASIAHHTRNPIRIYKPSRAPNRPRVYRIDKLIAAGTVVGLIGPAKNGKTSLCKQLGLCFSTGRPFLGFEVLIPSPVLYLVTRDSEGDVGQYDAWVQRQAPGAPVYFAEMPGRDPEDADLRRSLLADAKVEDWARWAQDALEQCGAGVLIVEMARGVFNPDTDWFSYGEVSQQVEPWSALSRRTGATVILQHHTRKTLRNPGHVDPYDDGLGSAAFGGSVDDALGILADRRRASAVLTAAGRNVQFAGEEMHLAFDRATETYTRADPLAEVFAEDPLEQQIVAVLQRSRGWRKLGAIAEGVHADARVVGPLLRKLTREHKVEWNEGKGPGSAYRVARPKALGH